MFNNYTSTPTTTPSRRSTRYKIQAADFIDSCLDVFSYTWLGPAFYTRRTSFENDLHQPEIEAIQTSLQGGGTNLDPVLMETTFYRAFSRVKGPLATPSKGKRQKIDAETYSVGDTVFIKSQTGVPNVAVIIALWDTQVIEGELPDGLRHNSMKVQVHWFMRPHQCAMVRKHRKFYQVGSLAVFLLLLLHSHLV